MIYILTQQQQRTIINSLFYVIYERQVAEEAVLNGELNGYFSDLYTDPVDQVDKIEEDGNLLLENTSKIEATVIIIRQIRSSIINNNSDVTLNPEQTDIINEALIQYLSDIEGFIDPKAQKATPSPIIQQIYFDMSASWNEIFLTTDLEKADCVATNFWIAEYEIIVSLLDDIFPFKE